MTLTLTHLALFVFGVLYDQLVTWLENRGYHEGYVALLVVGGCGVTIVASSIIVGNWAAWETFKCFASSGLPMFLGSAWRHVNKRRKDREETKQELLYWQRRREGDGDTAEGGETELE